MKKNLFMTEEKLILVNYHESFIVSVISYFLQLHCNCNNDFDNMVRKHKIETRFFKTKLEILKIMENLENNLHLKDYPFEHLLRKLSADYSPLFKRVSFSSRTETFFIKHLVDYDKHVLNRTFYESWLPESKKKIFSEHNALSKEIDRKSVFDNLHSFAFADQAFYKCEIYPARAGLSRSTGKKFQKQYIKDLHKFAEVTLRKFKQHQK